MSPKIPKNFYTLLLFNNDMPYAKLLFWTVAVAIAVLAISLFMLYSAIHPLK